MFWLIGLYFNNIEVNQVSQKDVTITCCSKTPLHFKNVFFPKMWKHGHRLQKNISKLEALGTPSQEDSIHTCKAVCVSPQYGY